MKRCRLKRYNFQITKAMSKENKTSNKQEHGNDFIADVSSSLSTEFGIWNTKDKILVSKYSDKAKAERICGINSRMSGKLHKVVKVVVLDCY
jgi:hypothetical protein